MANRRVTRWAVAVLASLLAACASRVAAPPDITKREPAEFPGGYYRSLAAQGALVLRVDPAHSLVIIEVQRSGSLARLGHNHVIASHDVAGYLAPDEGRADLYVPLDALVVDEPALRAKAGLETQPSPADIAGTRRNMLERVLETNRFPHALIAVRGNVTSTSEPRLRVSVTLHGIHRAVDASLQIQRDAEEIEVAGTLAIDQSSFGITPFSVLGGAIAVQDGVQIKFQIRAIPVKQRRTQVGRPHTETCPSRRPLRYSWTGQCASAIASKRGRVNFALPLGRSRPTAEAEEGSRQYAWSWPAMARAA